MKRRCGVKEEGAAWVNVDARAQREDRTEAGAREGQAEGCYTAQNGLGGVSISMATYWAGVHAEGYDACMYA